MLDGAAVVHFLSTKGNNTFDDFAENTFIPYVDRQLQHADRLDIVWDEYKPDSLKTATRQKRGEGVRK